MAAKKTIYEEALLDAKKIQEALNFNTKEILRSIAKEEIDSIVKESLNEEESDYEEETVDSDTDEVGDGESDDTGITPDTETDDEESEIEIGDDSEEAETISPEVGNDDQELEMDADAFDGDEIDMTGASDDDVIEIYKKLSGGDEIEIVGDEVHMNISEPGEYIVKKSSLGTTPSMGDDTEGIGAGMDSLEMGDDTEGMDTGMDSLEMGDDTEDVDTGMNSLEMGDDTEDDEEGLTYEIAMDEETIDEGFMDNVADNGVLMAILEPLLKKFGVDQAKIDSIIEVLRGASSGISSGKGLSEGFMDNVADNGVLMAVLGPILKKFGVDQAKIDSITEILRGASSGIAQGKGIQTPADSVQEAIPVGTAQARHQGGAGANIGQPKGAGAASLKENEVKYNKLLTESQQLKNENEEFRKALKKFRSMLVETVVFNSNLSYVTKLFMEHSTTKDEKKSIITRFDEEVSNLKESKKLYRTIANELTNRKPINESVENKIIKGVVSSGAKQLNETAAYVDPSTLNIIDLMKRMEKR
jgi:hypothetical protein